MKKLLLFLTVILFQGNSYAQQYLPAKQRLTGYSSKVFDGSSFQYEDSSVYTYTGTRSSTIAGYTNNFPLAQYDNILNRRFHTGGTGWMSRTRYIQTFDVNDNVLSLEIQSWNNTTGKWIDSLKTLFTYTAAKDTASVTKLYYNLPFNTFDTGSIYTHTYDANGDRVLTIVSIRPGNITYNSQKNIYTYNGAHQLTDDLGYACFGPTQPWVNYTHNSYIYSGNQVTFTASQRWNIPLNAWADSQRTFFHYNALQKTDTIVDQYYDDATAKWTDRLKRVFTYTNDEKPDTREVHFYDTLAKQWLFSQYIKYTYTNGNNTLVLIKTGEGTELDLENYSQVHIEYNSSNLTTHFWGEQWNDIGGFWDATKWRKYYFHYADSNLGIAKTNAIAGSLNLYPVPANDILHINANWNIPQPFTAIIYNITGHRVMQWSEAPQQNYNTDISISALPAGNYTLQLQGNSGAITKKFVVQ